MLRRSFALVVLSAIVALADAGTLYTIRTSDRVLRALDTNTLQFTNIGPIGVAFDFGGLAWDGSNMYMVQGFAGTNLYRLNLQNGSATLVGSHGFNDMFGLAWDPSTGKLYSGRSTRGTGFYSIDRNNGSATFIGNPGVNLDGLDYDSRRDMVVGGHAGPGDLYAINRSDGSRTLLYDGAFFNNCGMAYDPDTDKHWMIDWSGNLYTFDPNNAYNRTLVLSGLGAHDGLEFVPEPGTIALLLVGGVALLRRR